MPKMKTAQPARKVYASTTAGAVVTIITWALREWLGMEVSGEVSVAIATVVAFLAGYYTPPSPKDQVVIERQDEGVL